MSKASRILELYSNVTKMADKAADKAKNGTLNYNGEIYTFTFHRGESVYIVSKSDGTEEVRLNTKKITVAKKEFKKFMES